MSGLIFGHGKSSTSTTETKLNSVSLQQSTIGIPVSLVYGTHRKAANIIDYGDFTPIPHTETQRSGGKGGHSQTSTNTTYTYTVGFLMALGEGPIDVTGKVYKGATASTMEKEGLTFFRGTDDQTPWSSWAGKHPDKALSYRGTGYAATLAYDLGNSSTLPNLSFECIGKFAQPSRGGDAYVRDIMIDVLTNPRYGAGFPTERLGDLTALHNYTVANGIWISPVYDTQVKAEQIITDLMKISNCQALWSQGKLKVIPYSMETITANGVTYSANSNPQYELTEDDFICEPGEDPIEMTREDTEDAYNHQDLEFVDRNNDYNTDTVSAEELAAIEVNGRRTADVVTLHQICNRDVAQRVCQNILNRNLYIRNIYNFKLSWKYSRLEPMDLIAITHPFLGMNRTLCRVVTIEDTDDFTLQVTAEEVYEATSGVTVYPSQTADRSKLNYNLTVGNINDPIIFEPPDEISNGLKVRAAVSFGDENTGGCSVWASTTGEGYIQIGTINANSRQGVLTADLPTSSTAVDETNTLAVNLSMSRSELISVSREDANMLTTLCYVDGEIIGYQNATLTASHRYNLTYLIRGVYGTPIKAHSAGSSFVKLDNGRALDYPFKEDNIGKTIYLKFTAFNVFGSNEQSLMDVREYMYTPKGTSLLSSLPNVTGLKINYVDNKAMLSWEPIVDFRSPIYYEIRQGNVLNNAQVLGRVPGTTFSLPYKGVYWIAGVYQRVYNGQNYIAYSRNWVSIECSLTNIPLNELTTINEDEAHWTGSMTPGCMVDNNVLQLGYSTLVDDYPLVDDILDWDKYGNFATSGTYTIPVDHRINLDTEQALTFSMSLEASVIRKDVLFDDTPDVDALDAWDSDNPNNGSAVVQINTAGDDGVWKGWQDFIPGQYYGSHFDFRINISTTDDTYNVLVSKFRVSATVATRWESGQVSVPVGGIRVNYAKRFNNVPKPSITIFNGDEQEFIKLTQQNSTGFFLSLTKNGQGVARDINWTSVGY